MEKKEYKEPVVEITEFESEDVIAPSMAQVKRKKNET